MTRAGLVAYHSIYLPTRGSVSEPLMNPRMRLLRESGKVVEVPMGEAQLLAVIEHAVQALDLMRQSRGATKPEGSER